MQIIIDIPDNEVPEKQDIIATYIHFIDGEVCEVGHYGFMTLPKEHGDLIDRDAFRSIIPTPVEDEYKYIHKLLYDAPVIVPADEGE